MSLKTKKERKKQLQTEQSQSALPLILVQNVNKMSIPNSQALDTPVTEAPYMSLFRSSSSYSTSTSTKNKVTKSFSSNPTKVSVKHSVKAVKSTPGCFDTTYLSRSTNNKPLSNSKDPSFESQLVSRTDAFYLDSDTSQTSIEIGIEVSQSTLETSLSDTTDWDDDWSHTVVSSTKSSDIRRGSENSVLKKAKKRERVSSLGTSSLTSTNNAKESILIRGTSELVMAAAAMTGAQVTEEQTRNQNKDMDSEYHPPPAKKESLEMEDGDDECEFMVAADLTLYTNPINSILGAGKSSTKKKNDHKNEEKDMIAADLTKYDSPLAAMDKSHTDRQRQNYDPHGGGHQQGEKHDSKN
ncbi:unnamed protein product [Owenia fusiformis]|uniref:Uncharacterized protein n=1 Tax=Owenia fusiformis TaxID=6347 RepID=A0A8S4MXY0_OWEFU|nr:unnamed protein product [Owenia fusiformis]